MADVRISQLPVAPDPIDGTELVPVVQNGQTVQTTVADIMASPSQTQTFLTVNQESTLPNSRYISTDANLSLTDGGVQSYYRINLTGAAASLNAASTGLIAKDSASTVVNRQLTASGNGIGVTNGNGVSGNPTIALTGIAAGVANLSGTGIVAVVGSSSAGLRTLQGVSNQVVVTNGNGSSDPSIGLASNPVIPGVEGVQVPAGTTAERSGSVVNGVIRYNTTTAKFEGYTGSWQSFGNGDGTVTSVNASGGSTGLSFTGGPITSSGTLTLTGVPTLAANLQGGSANKIPYQSGTDTTAFVDAPVSGDTFLKWNGVGFEWGAVAGAGTVTSVGLSLPSDFTVTNSPVTAAGTLTATYASQAANRVFAAPDGSSGTPSFRALVNDDLPASGVTANTYGSSTAVPVITVNAKGVITSVTTAGIVGGLNYHGAWNASTNTPTLTSSVGVNGDYYVVSVAGTTNLNGITDWQIGDWAIFNGSVWQKVDQTNTVSSVNGYTGAVTLSYTDVGAPSTSGTNATGTWAIDISGNAATATTATSATSATSATTATTATNVAGGAAGSLVYQTALATTSTLALGTLGDVLVAGASAPTYVAQSTLSVGSAASATTAGSVTNSVTFNNTGGGSPGTSFNGSSAITIDYSSVGAPKADGTGASGTWSISINGNAATATSATSATSATTATNATNVATTATSTDADFYIPFVASPSTGNQALGVDAGITYNPSTNAMTSGISGGTF